MSEPIVMNQDERNKAYRAGECSSLGSCVLVLDSGVLVIDSSFFPQNKKSLTKGKGLYIVVQRRKITSSVQLLFWSV